MGFYKYLDAGRFAYSHSSIGKCKNLYIYTYYRTFNDVELHCLAKVRVKTAGDAVAGTVYFIARLLDHTTKRTCLDYMVLCS